MTTVPEFFSGKNVLITGGSGFLGKVLIEKLLRSCPNIGNLYILLREKRGVQPEERLKAMLKLPVSWKKNIISYIQIATNYYYQELGVLMHYLNGYTDFIQISRT